MPNISADLESKIDQIPSEGEWWKQDTRETFLKVAGVMLAAGIPEADILELLTEMFWAVSAEYGN